MKKNIIITLTVLLFLNCNNEPKLEYRYADKEDLFECSNLNNQLYKEALYTFEQDLIDFHNTIDSKITDCYVSFLHRQFNDNIKYKDFVSPHSLLVLEALKQDTTLWDFDNKKSYLNYTSPIMNCIANNIQNKDIKTTLNALLSVGSMDPNLFRPVFAPKYEELISDKYLALYVALDLYYAKLIDVDFTDKE